MNGRASITTTALRNSGKGTVTCDAIYALLDDARGRTLRGRYSIEPGRAQIEEATLIEAGAVGTIRFDCSGDVLIAALVRASSDGGKTFNEGRAFRAVTQDDPVTAALPKTLNAPTDLLLMEANGRPARAHIVVRRHDGRKIAEKTYDIAAFAQRLIDLSKIRRVESFPRVEISISGDGALVISRESHDAALLELLRSKPETTKVSAVAAASTSVRSPIENLLGVASFKAAPFREPMTGLVYMRDRWYDPHTGSFLSPDPEGYADSADLYSYCGGDPVNCSDPTGLAASVSRSGVIVGIRPDGTRYRIGAGTDPVEALRILESDPDLRTAADQEDILTRAGMRIPYSSGPRPGETLIGSATTNYRAYTHLPHGGRGGYLIGAIMPNDLPASTREMQIGQGTAQVVGAVASTVTVAYAGSRARVYGGGRTVQPMTTVTIDGMRIKLPRTPPPGPPMSNAQVRQWYLDQDQRIPSLNAEWTERGVELEMRARLAFGIRYQARMTARKMMTDPTEAAQLRARDLQKYGNVNGPTFDVLVEQLRARGLHGDAIYEEIIRSSTRTDPETNRRFGMQ